VPTGEGGPIAEVAAIVAEHRPDSRRLRQLVCLLTERPMDLAALVRQSALPRKTVEVVLAAVGDDLVRESETVSLAPARAAGYREAFGCHRLAATGLADPLAARMAEATALCQTMAKLIAGAPAARPHLDHVQATPETVVRRALWLDSSYDLDGAVLLCVGDHDLTSLAVGQVSPGASIVVLDVDEATLEYIDDAAARLGLDIRCLASDLRLWLAESAAGCADLVFTDPPYTAEGLTLFAARSLQGLANRDHGRIVVAYGYSARHPSLGWQGQSAAHRLGLAAEAQIPAFNRYEGAQAVGSASDLYVWRPTSRSWRQLDGVLADIQTNIYTRGGQSLERPVLGEQSPGVQSPGEQGAGGQAEGEQAQADGNAWASVPSAIYRVTTDAGFPVKVMAAATWAAATWAGHQAPAAEAAGSTGADRSTGAHESALAHGRTGPARLRLSTLISAGIPPGMTGRDRFAVAADLSADPGSWLLRVLLAANADRVAAVVPSGHPDVRDETGQHGLAALLTAKYSLRFLRGQPGSDHTIVVATAVATDPADPGERLAAWVLRRAHGKIGNVWREGLIDAVPPSDGTRLTRRDARAIVAASASRPAILGARLIDLPRHQIAGLLEDARASAAFGTQEP
jgi:N4-bis(aminopropyl)spermidine synthase